MKHGLQFLGAKRHVAVQQGQALIEFLVIALVLVPLFLLMPMIAKYQDIGHATQMASRYVAFEAMTRNAGMSSWKPENQLAGEVRRRFFSNPGAPIKTGDTAGNFKAHQNLFWRDPRGNALIANFDDVKISFGPGNSPSHGGGFSAASDGKPFKGKPLPFSVHDKLDLQASGIYTANISVALVDLPSELDSYSKSYEEFRNIGLTMRRQTSLLVDSWTASGPAQVESRIATPLLFPGSTFVSNSALADAVTAVHGAVAVMESPRHFPAPCLRCGPKLGELEFWRDVVPADRLH